ncbi:MAG: hypothetical protein ACT4QG_21645 [Sporichthyaceae bacterium]
MLLPVFVLVLAAVMTWELFARSTIPFAFDGTVTSVVAKDEHPGTRNAWFVRVGETSRQVDTAVGERLTVGDRVRKDAWSRELQTGDRTVRVSPSRDAKAALVFGPAAVVLTAVVAARTRAGTRTRRTVT